MLTDPTKSPRWSANAIEAELITPRPPGIGSRRRAVAKGPFGGTMENVMEVTELEPNRKVALKLVRAPWGGTGRHVVHVHTGRRWHSGRLDVGDGTSWTLEATRQSPLHGAIRPPVPT